MPDFYIAALPHSVSSIHWRDDVRFTPDDQLAIEIVVPAEEANDKSDVVELLLDPMSGAISPKSPKKWQAALEKGREVATARDKAERQEQAAFIAPLLGPKSRDESQWHQYLLEAFFRLDSDWENDFPAIKVLRVPSAADFKASREWLEEALVDPMGDVLAIASLSSADDLVSALSEISGKIRKSELRNSRIYIAASAEDWPRIQAVMAPTGAKLIHLDPMQPIPQRPERLKARAATSE